ncbi:KAP family P-loop NTPase fold protein [Vibrio furnissii]|uniref:KAP family P-loop NTPase fold protein n=1 Tax=Vibrio furnissii TaxID=29494 RepID=UPI0015589EFB|nr:P-loop NTPase fold protein [Vibrio furnissii]
MKLIVPELEINEDSPFSSDLFEREKFAEKLTNLIRNVEDNLVISLDANWGEGKSTFIRMWRLHLKNQGIKTVCFDAFKNDYSNDPFLDIAGEVFSFTDTEFSENDEIISSKGQLKSKAVNVGKRLVGWTAKVAVKTATLGAIKDSDIEELQDVAKDISKDSGDLVSNVILDRLNNHEVDKNSIEVFNKNIEDLGTKIRNAQGFPLLIIVDELDRCRPSYAVETIEKIKHLFSAKNVVFVLTINKKQLQESIRSVYGEIDAATYLKKFIHLEASLPRRHGYNQTNDYLQYSSYLYSALDFPDWLTKNKDDICRIFACYAEYYNLTLRDMERAYTNLAIYYASVSENTINYFPVICFLSIIKVKSTVSFKMLKDGKYTYNEFEEEFSIQNISKDYYRDVYPEYFTTCFKFFLYNDEEYQKEKQSTDLQYMNLGGASISRKKVIPWYCDQIDAFNVNIA